MTYPYHIKQTQQAEMTDDAGVYLPTGPGDAQRADPAFAAGTGALQNDAVGIATAI